MSMPQPIYVALVGSKVDVVRNARKHFRLSAPGIGAAYLATLEPNPTDPIQRLDDIPSGIITLWVTLDGESFSACQDRHRTDVLNPRYGRGFYKTLLPDPCLLFDFERMQLDLSVSFGEPSRVGTDDDEDIPLCGVFRFAVWRIEGRALYVAAAHEDRECPILLMLGITSR